ncbi:hypothetical protein VTL71DRAFT_4447 [Oculimacula yallundae]|uniref:Rhodopsin domain-containing protein n=1 Tax=Oculimacula yallundae TaxID=86028 RepID=A0ABR4C4F0_9HELO
MPSTSRSIVPPRAGLSEDFKSLGMASNGTKNLLPGQSVPLTTITSTDQSGVLLIVTALGLAFALVSIFIRIYIQLGLRNSADRVVVISMVFYVFHATAIFFAASKGFGRTIEHISQNHLVPIQKSIYSSELLYIVTIWLTKCSVALLLVRLSPNKRHNLASYTILGASTVFMVVSVLIVSLRCDFTQPWTFIDAQCPQLLDRWQTVAAMDIVTELALFSTSIYLVKNLQLSLQKKSLVVFAFGLRLPMIAPIILRLFSILSTLHSQDPTLAGTMTIVYTQIELCYAIIAATTPCLRPFMKALSTHYGAPATLKITPSNTNTYSLNSISKRSKIPLCYPTKLQRDDNDVPVLRWDKTTHHASVVGGDQRSLQSHGSKSMIISKDTQWAVDFESGEGERL